jgi:hypothetical protein
MVRRFPEVEEPIRDLPMFFGLSRQEAKQLVATLRPMELVPRRTIVTEVPPLPATKATPTNVQPGSGPDTSVTVGPETWVTVSAHALDRDRPCERAASIRTGSA